MAVRWGGVLKGSAAGGGGGGGAGGTLTGTWVASDDVSSPANQHTFSGMNFGTAAANRLLIVAACSSGNSPAPASSVTIGGVSATLVKSVSGSQFVSASLWQALVPSGTSGTVVVNWSGTASCAGIGIWSVQTDTQGAQNSGSSTGSSIAAVVPTSGYGIVAYQVNCNTTITGVAPSNFTEDYEDIFTTGRNAQEGGHFTASATIDTTTSPSANDEALVYASWGP
jgi:hypothetical protein